MKYHGLHTFGMKCGLLLVLQGCSTITYMRVSEPVRLEAVVVDAPIGKEPIPSLNLECQAPNPSERSALCTHVTRDIEKGQRFTIYSPDEDTSKPDYAAKVQLVQQLEDGPGFWDYTFSFLTLSIYPQETRMFYELRFSGNKVGSPDRLNRSLRCHTIRRFGGLYKLGSVIADMFRSTAEKETDDRREQQEASQDLYYFLNSSLDDLKLSQEGDRS